MIIISRFEYPVNWHLNLSFIIGVSVVGEATSATIDERLVWIISIGGWTISGSINRVERCVKWTSFTESFVMSVADVSEFLIPLILNSN